MTSLPEPRSHTCSDEHCYRLDAGRRLEESTDGGETWRELWSLPKEADDWTMYDVAFVAGTDVVLIAVGDNGVLRREGFGRWEAVRVTPAPSQSFSTGA